MKPIRSELAALADPERARQVARFFQNGPGQYAEGDIFWGLPNPQVREVAKRWSHFATPLRNCPLPEGSTICSFNFSSLSLAPGFGGVGI